MFEPRVPLGGKEAMLVAHEASPGSFDTMNVVGRVLASVGTVALRSFGGEVSIVKR